MGMNQAEGEFLALLVHKGFLTEARARVVMGESREGESLPACLEKAGLFPAGEAQRLFDNRVGENPQFARYDIQRELGSGATAYVFEATDKKDGGSYALKVLREEVARWRPKLERFVEEAQLLCRLRHPGLVAGHRVARDKGTVYLVMDLISGETLEDRLLRGERYEELDALRIVHQIAQCLAYLRSEGLVHRDLKPGNVMDPGNGRVQLIDLGFAVQIGETDESSTTVGTVEYIAPEQARGEGGLDARADIYSLGATLYHLTVGELPFAGESNQEVLLKQVMAELSSERIRELNLSPQLHYFIEKMMAKDRTIRYQAPEELVLDLEEKLGNELVPEAGPEGDTPIVQRRPRHRRDAPTPRHGSKRPGRRRR